MDENPYKSPTGRSDRSADEPRPPQEIGLALGCGAILFAFIVGIAVFLISIVWEESRPMPPLPASVHSD